MKTLLALFAALITVTTTAAAQHAYKDGELFKINDTVTLQCTMSQQKFIGLRSTEKFEFDKSVNDVVTSPEDYSVFKRAFEETFTSEERDKYKDVMIGLCVIHDGRMRPTDVWFSFENKIPDNTIPPTKFATLRQKILNYVTFRANPYTIPDKYYRWYDGIGSMRYYLNITTN